MAGVWTSGGSGSKNFDQGQIGSILFWVGSAIHGLGLGLGLGNFP